MSETTTHAQVNREAFCVYCGGKLNLGYHFMCHLCGGIYCYIHMARHARAHAPQALRDQVNAS
jgi:hypothetical protein